MKIQKETFFAQIGSALFKNRLSDTQRQGLNTLLGYWEQHFSKQDLRWLAYVLGTVHHEVRKSMQPIHEDGADQYFFDKYDIQGHNPETAKELGNIYPGDGVKFHGRGFVQLTGRSNYAYWAKRLNLDLLNDPDNALQPEVASTILFHGMIEGRFTGKALSDYINETEEDWINARRIVNRLDKAEEIKTYAQQYWEVLKQALITQSPVAMQVGKDYRVTTQRTALNLRKSPDTHHEPIGKLARGMIVRVMAKVDNSSWVLVDTNHDGKAEGYCDGTFLVPVKELADVQ